MQKHGGRQQARQQIAEINHLVESVELAGVVKAEGDERGQAKNIEMLRLMRAAPAEINEQARSAGTPSQPGTGKSPPDRAAARPPAAWRSLPRRGSAPGTWLCSTRRCGPAPLATSVARSIRTPSISSRWSPAMDSRRYAPDSLALTYSASTAPCRSTQITPSSGRRKSVLLLKVNKRRHTGGERKDREDCGGQLELEFLQHNAAGAGWRDNTPKSPEHV